MTPSSWKTSSATIEKIYLTYVVVKLWDERRLIMPIARFLEAPFQNWSFKSHQLTGVVLLQVDYTAPVDRIRAELIRICNETPLWDRRACKLHVTDLTDRVMTLRALVTAKDADDLFDLRCAVREALMSFLYDLDGGRYLARVRNDDVATAPITPCVST